MIPHSRTLYAVIPLLILALIAVGCAPQATPTTEVTAPPETEVVTEAPP